MSIGSDATGLRLTEVLLRAYQYGISLQSDYARSNSLYVAMGASLGYLTTRLSPRSTRCSNRWRITKEGLAYLERTKE